MRFFGRSPVQGPQIQTPPSAGLSDSVKQLIVVVIIVAAILGLAISNARKKEQTAPTTANQHQGTDPQTSAWNSYIETWLANRKAQQTRQEAPAQANPPAAQPAPAAAEDPVHAALRMKFALRDFASPDALEQEDAASPPRGPVAGPEGEAKPQPVAALPPASPEADAIAPEPKSPPAPPPLVQAMAAGKRYVVFEGTYLDAVLLNRLDSRLGGPVVVQGADDVLSHDRQRVLIPAGTKVIGESARVSEHNEERVAIKFHRMIMPDGYPVNLDQFTGLDQAGSAGVKGKINHHYMMVIGSSVALGVVSGLELTSNVSTLTEGGALREGFGMSAGQEGQSILNQFLNRAPTITIPEGTRMKVYITQDLSLPDYAMHQMPSDL